jgi:hypothetical protein
MESDSKDLLIEQLQVELKQLKQVAESGLLNTNNPEDLSGKHFLSEISTRYWHISIV